ncbi:prepilin-type N-terminal cleavage/methylation domain-containing protein [Pseudomonas viridiflava]|uniref:GspH/FimT family pseudopilin n=1 Tax=Pseudomonas syringae group TaxID=136849 RepID=UPI0015E4039D|nr:MULTISPECIES: GspH/FimT family pseudopilin [Pseudomonas syringae group]MBA1229948.1 prepilin-type N-terminal cleavage/methylation domain-containing protein [Pseudomonas viridiflava]MCF5707666.1 prepilin-type N-terminal cleavage/methylation domain-containing protein [Pseudomonas syringae]
MKPSGFTLIELLVVVALVAILANVATPSVTQIIDSNRRLVAAQELASGIRSARVAAITHNQLVTVHAIEADWSKGWRIILDPDGKGPDDQDVLLIERARTANTRIVGNRKLAGHLTFNGLGGLVNRANGTLFVCVRNQPVSHYRVIVAATGRVRIADQKTESPLCG